MNIFRLAGDMSHVFSIIVLLLRLRVAKNAQGQCVCVCLGLSLSCWYTPVIVGRYVLDSYPKILLLFVFCLCCGRYTHRNLRAYTRVVFDCLCHPVFGPLYHVLFGVQFHHEGIVYCQYRIYHIHYQIPRTHQDNL
jgi:hypothetical protein